MRKSLWILPVPFTVFVAPCSRAQTFIYEYTNSDVGISGLSSYTWTTQPMP